MPVDNLALCQLPQGIRSSGVERREADEDLCNDQDMVHEGRDMLVWYMRHGESTGNVAKNAAWAADEGTGRTAHFEAYITNMEYADAPLTELGCQQAQDAARLVASWSARPTLIVSSPLTRAIQTAALVFEAQIAAGTARLIIRPELREFWSDNIENSGRPLPELRQCPRLRCLPQWAAVEGALSDEVNGDWASQWNHSWANTERHPRGWREHCADPDRLRAFGEWLASQHDRYVAIVSHIGTINNILNREPWTHGRPRHRQPADFWPEDGIVRRFNIRNAGWVAVRMVRSAARAQDDVEDESAAVRGARKRVLQSLKVHKQDLAIFLPSLLKVLAPIDQGASRKLLKRLSRMAQEGAPPSFADVGARSGYIRRRMEHRSAQIFIFLQHPLLQRALDALLPVPRSDPADDSTTCAPDAAARRQVRPFRVASFGGGGGSDAVGLILLRNHLQCTHKVGGTAVGRPLHVCVFDMEAGWEEAVGAILPTMERVGIACRSDQVEFAQCDCVKSIGACV